MSQLINLIDSTYDTINQYNQLKGKNMEQNIKKWLWQHKNYPTFPYDKIALQEIIAKIEGEYFKRDSVRSSVRKKLDENFSLEQDSSTHRSDALVAILLDANLNREPLSVERLHGWHNALFVGGYDVLQKINVATFRAEDKMEVVSGAIGHEKIHYLAPPSKLIEEDVLRLLNYCNESDENIYIKSAIAHLWFVAIHPYDDGNGRIARAITDYLLSSMSKGSFKLYSISTAINTDKYLT